MEIARSEETAGASMGMFLTDAAPARRRVMVSMVEREGWEGGGSFHLASLFHLSRRTSRGLLELHHARYAPAGRHITCM